MTDDPDRRIGDLLRNDAPPERDPVFRVAVLERLERTRHHRRMVVAFVGAVAFAGIAALGASIGGATREATGIALVGVALTAAYFVVAPAVTSLLSLIRS